MSLDIVKARLAWLVASGLMTHVDGNYVPTQMGLDVAPTIIALSQWGDTWNAPNGRPIIDTRTPCGHDLALRVVCTHCGVVNDPAEVAVRLGPGMPAEVLPPVATAGVPPLSAVRRPRPGSTVPRWPT